MTMRVKRVMFIVLALVGVSLYIGCSQPEDIITSVGNSSLLLRSQMLPKAPAGMAYELWVVDGTDSTSLGKFNYDPDTRNYLNADGTLRADSNEFILDSDILSFDKLLVSIEVEPDDNLSSPGPVMLVDDITNPDDNPIELVFPMSDSMWNTTVRFNMQTMSDTDRTANNGAGIWFASYLMQTTTLQDTFAVISYTIDTTMINELPAGKTDTTSTVWIGIDSMVPVQRILGLDTFTAFTVVLTESTYTDSSSPYVTTSININYRLGPLDTVTYDQFVQDDFGLFDYSAMGWKYKGWVVAPIISSAGASVGELTSPAWKVATQFDTIIHGADGGLLSTGTFSDITAPDDQPLYALSERVPPFPGDEFFTSLPGGVTGPLNLLPSGNDNIGTVFITLEPDNFVTDTTNFPLIAYLRQMPTSVTEVSGGVALQQFTMDNLMFTVDPNFGFPKVTVDLIRR